MRISVGPSGAEAVGGLLASMSGAVVHDPEDAASGFVRLLAHDFAHEPIDGSNSILDFAAAEDLGAMDIPGRQVGPGTFAKVLMLDPGGAVRTRAATSVVFGGGLECWSFRPPR